MKTGTSPTSPLANTPPRFHRTEPGSRSGAASPGDHDIFVMEPNGNIIARLTNSPGIDDDSPSWSSDGSRIVFESDRNENYDIYVMNDDGTGPGAPYTQHGSR